MLPTPGALLTVITPSATIQRAGEASWADAHSSRLRPSNSTIASDGGAMPTPGVTTLGTGSQSSVSCGFGCAASVAAARIVSANRFVDFERINTKGSAMALPHSLALLI